MERCLVSRSLSMLSHMCARFVSLFAHIIGTRARWFHVVLGEGDAAWTDSFIRKALTRSQMAHTKIKN